MKETRLEELQRLMTHFHGEHYTRGWMDSFRSNCFGTIVEHQVVNAELCRLKTRFYQEY